MTLAEGCYTAVAANRGQLPPRDLYPLQRLAAAVSSRGERWVLVQQERQDCKPLVRSLRLWPKGSQLRCEQRVDRETLLVEVQEKHVCCLYSACDFGVISQHVRGLR